MAGPLESTSIEPPESSVLTPVDSSLDSSFPADFYGAVERDPQTLDAKDPGQGLVAEETDAQNISSIETNQDRQDHTEEVEAFQGVAQSGVAQSNEVAGSSTIRENPSRPVEASPAPQEELSGESLLLDQIERIVEARTPVEGQTVEGRSLVLDISKAIEAYHIDSDGKRISRETAGKLLEYRLKAAEGEPPSYAEAVAIAHKRDALGSLQADMRSRFQSKEETYIEVQSAYLKQQAIDDSIAARAVAEKAYKPVFNECEAYSEVCQQAKESFQGLQNEAGKPDFNEADRERLVQNLNRLDDKLAGRMRDAATPENFEERLQAAIGVVERADDTLTIARSDMDLVRGLRASPDTNEHYDLVKRRLRDVLRFERTLREMDADRAYNVVGNEIRTLRASIAELRETVDSLPAYVPPPDYSET